MNTIMADRLWADPRLRDLADRVRCPLRALGLLASVWHGTQNLGVVYAEKAAILNSLPAGMRRDPRYVDAMVASGWLVPHGELFEVVGNSDHVQAREGMSERGKRGAAKRWGKADASSISTSNANEMPARPPDPPLPPDPIRSERESERAPDAINPLGSNHPEVQFFEADYRRRFGGGPLSKFERARAAEVVRRCAEAKVRWQDVLAFYAAGFEFSGHTVEWLRDNLREVLNKLSKASNAPSDDPEPDPLGADGGAAWVAWNERRKARGGA